jgi:hypothetical protein
MTKLPPLTLTTEEIAEYRSRVGEVLKDLSLYESVVVLGSAASHLVSKFGEDYFDRASALCWFMHVLLNVEFGVREGTISE